MATCTPLSKKAHFALPLSQSGIEVLLAKGLRSEQLGFQSH